MLWPGTVRIGVLGCCCAAALLARRDGGDTGAAGCTKARRPEGIGNDSGAGRRGDAGRLGASAVGGMHARHRYVGSYGCPGGRVPRGRTR